MLLPLLAGAVIFAAGANPRILSRSQRTNPAHSAQFRPLEFQFADSTVRNSFAAWLKSQPHDSTTWAVWNAGTLRLSTDMAIRLGAWEESGTGFRSRVQSRLQRLGATGVVASEPAYAAEYFSNDKWLQGSPQWGLSNPGIPLDTIKSVAGIDIGMTRVWDRFDGDDSLVVAVVDAGIDFHHPDLQGRWFVNQAEAHGVSGIDDDQNGFVDDTAGWDFVENDNLPQDCHGHGTEISGAIAARFDNAVGIAGMLPRVKILPVRVLDASGAGQIDVIAKGIQYAVKMHADVINFSIGGASNSAAFKAAFQAAHDSGVYVAAAAGNDGLSLDTHPVPPSSYGFDNVYMVASHKSDGVLSTFSNYGKTTVPMAAPGEYVLTTGILPDSEVFAETFDTGLSRWTFAKPGEFILSTLKPLEGTQTLQWAADSNAWAVTNDFIDLRNQTGGLLTFFLDFTPASLRDFLIIEGLREGASQWTEIGVVPTAYKGGLAFGLQGQDSTRLDDSRFKLRFRTTASGSVASRILRLDNVHVYCISKKPLPADPSDPVIYPTVAGTSIASPFMAGYLALMKIACKRMGIPMTRNLVLAGAVPDSFLTGKVVTGGRLSVPLGLDFYLKTLPQIQITDSSHSNWNQGETVQYKTSVRATDSAAYRFSALSELSGFSMDSTAGNFSWSSGSSGLGPYAVRFRANANPLVLRREVSFSLVPAPVGVPARKAGAQPTLAIGRQVFLLPAAFFLQPGHYFRVDRMEADGRVLPVFSGALATPGSAQSYGLPGFTGLGWRVWVDGQPLTALR